MTWTEDALCAQTAPDAFGYDTEWVGVRASDIGAPHSRFRVFVVAWPADPQSVGHANEPGRGGLVEVITQSGSSAGTNAGRYSAGVHRWTANAAELARHGDMAGPSRTGETDREQRQRNGHAADYRQSVDWGVYGPAIARWESVLGRPAPSPTLPDGKAGQHRLNPWLTEWMMGAPEGWICSPEIGLTRNEQLAACGNGVVPQQCAYALRILFNRMPAWVLGELGLAA